MEGVIDNTPALQKLYNFEIAIFQSLKVGQPVPQDVMTQEAKRGIQDGFFPEENKHENHNTSNPNYQITRNKGKGGSC